MTLALIFILAITVEALVEYAKLIFQKEINWKQIGAIAVAIGLSLAASTDLYAILGVTFRVPYLGMILTGILFSRGANAFADFVKLAQTATGTMAALREEASASTYSMIADAPEEPDDANT